MADKAEAKLSRRDFVRTSGLGVAAGVAAAGLVPQQAEAGAQGSTAGDQAGRYRLTQHVKTYYAMARL
jgi:anaerobic selenocysteine-containing dehydrogenase